MRQEEELQALREENRHLKALVAELLPLKEQLAQAQARIIARGTQEKLERVPVRIDHPVKGGPRSFDLDGGFIAAPGVSGGFEVRPAAFLQFRGIALHGSR